MRTFTVSEVQVRFGAFLDCVQNEPVRVMCEGRVVGVMVSAENC